MTRGAALYLVGSVAVLALAGCGGFLPSFEPRAAWRGEAEAACMRSGEVKTGRTVVPIRSIDGPGVCGAQQPLKVAALGDRTLLGYMQELRPPGAIPGFPIPEPRAAYPEPPRQSYPQQPRYEAYPQPRYEAYPQPRREAPSHAPYGARHDAPYGTYGAPPAPRGPVSLYPPGVPQPEPDAEGWQEQMPEAPMGEARRPRPLPPAVNQRPPRAWQSPPTAAPAQPAYEAPLPALGPRRGAPLSVSAATIKPEATLACPLVSRLDRWMVEKVQPTAQRWFGQPVAEIRQISAYSCRGMNGQKGAPISEHAFGNALDIAAFTLADGKRVTVQHGWRGSPQEQGFLRDVHAGACELFNTVLAPGSNRFHYDHIHVDLARRQSGRSVCNPKAVPGDLIARQATERTLARAAGGGRMGYAEEEEVSEDGTPLSQLPRAIPGED